MASAFGVTLKKTTPDTGLVFSANGVNSMSTLKGVGACLAMVADWISQSKKLGRTAKSMDELSPSTAYVVAFAPEDFNFEVSDTGGNEDVMEAFSLHPHLIQTFQPVQFTTVAATIASNSGYMWLSIRRPHGGHSLGFRVQPGVYEYLDPNVGLYRTTSAIEFSAHLVSELTSKYPSFKTSAKLYDFV